MNKQLFIFMIFYHNYIIYEKIYIINCIFIHFIFLRNIYNWSKNRFFIDTHRNTKENHKNFLDDHSFVIWIVYINKLKIKK